VESKIWGQRFHACPWGVLAAWLCLDHGSRCRCIRDGLDVATWPQERSCARVPLVTPEAKRAARKVWKPHPDDEADVRDAAVSVERGELLSVEASESFLRWLEGSDNDSWRGELG
jgi:hypothetical protein